MNKICFFLLFLFSGTLLGSEISGIKILTPCPEKLSKVEFEIQSNAYFVNPYDYEEVALTGTFVSPSGIKKIIDGFYFQNFERKLENKKEILKKIGTPKWLVRFTPEEKGDYKAYFKFKNTNEIEVKFKVSEAKKNPHGFLSINQKNKRYFEFRDGKSFFPVGQNICWSQNMPPEDNPDQAPVESLGTFSFDLWFLKMAQAETNYVRLWAGPFNEFTLEKNDLKIYEEDAAWRLDYVLNLAEAKNLYVQLVFDSFNSLKDSPPYAYWHRNPYNQILKSPMDFFVDLHAKHIYQNRLRYIVARWGYSPNIFAWEFFNEVDLVKLTSFLYMGRISSWHEEMGNFLKNLDPYRHLVTTSFAKDGGYGSVDKLSQIDFTQSHVYQISDEAEAMMKWAQKKERYGKPHFFGEFGIDRDDKSPKYEADKDGISIHNSLWAALHSMDSASPMTWWWDTYIDPKNLYYRFTSLARYSRDIDFSFSSWTHLINYSLAPENFGVRVLGMMGGEASAFIWLQNKNSTWLKRVWEIEPLGRISESVLSFKGLQDGEYEAQIWDTERGEILKREKTLVKGGKVFVSLPSFETDIAVKILKK